jgi:arabinose-5-phosphate isomerase
MRKINKIKIAKNVIKIESKSLASIANKIGQSFQEACDIILKCKGRVVTIGLGKSGHIAAKSSATLSSTGTPSTFIHAGEALHGDIGGLKNEDVVLIYSNSGETREILQLLPIIKLLKINIISVVGDKESSLAKSSDIVIDCGVPSEACPLNLTPTSSVITAIGISDALAITLLECRGFTSKDFAKSHPHGSIGKRLLKKVSDVMFTKKLPLTNYNNKLMKSIEVMSKYNHGVVIAIDDRKNVVGIFTDGDLRRTLKKNPNISNILLKTVMTKKFIKVTDDILAAEALNIMEKNEITSLIVVEKNLFLDY